MALTILILALVESTKQHHIVGIFGFLHSIADQLVGTAVIAQILTGGHTGMRAYYVAHIAACKVYHNPVLGETGLKAIERRDLLLHLQR